MDFSIFTSPLHHIHNITVHSYEVDYKSRLNAFSLFNYFQEIAWEHAGILSFGKDDLEKRNLFWVLSRVRVEIERMPLWTENIKLITYPREVDGLFALRDYEIYDSEGNRIISASSSWLILSAQTRRPVRVNDLGLPFTVNERKAMLVNASKVADCKGTPKSVDSLEVKASDIDVNLHVNNARYIEWAYNAFPIEKYKEQMPKVVEVNFLAESKYNDKISLELYEPNNSENTVSIKRIEDKKELCRVYFEWQTVK